MSAKAHGIWVVASDESPFSEWWPALCQEMGWPRDIHIERWSSESPWSQILDSAKNFSLFAKYKALVIEDAAKRLKGEESAQKWIDLLSQGPHKVILLSNSEPPRGLKVGAWKAPSELKVNQEDDKIAFKWIDGIHRPNLADALRSLEIALEQGQHPLALLQLVGRDFRVGRLIHHALSQRWKEAEIIERLRLNPYVVKKWLMRNRLPIMQWRMIFDRLKDADLELKSNRDEGWTLRKLTFDLIELSSRAHEPKRSARTMSTHTGAVQPLRLSWQAMAPQPQFI